MEKEKRITNRIEELKEHSNKTWADIAKIVAEEFSVAISGEQARWKYRKSQNKIKSRVVYGNIVKESHSNTEELLDDGSIISEKIISEDTENIIHNIKKNKGNKQKILEILGFDYEEWMLQNLRISRWQQKSKDEDKELYSLRYHVKPVSLNDITLKQKCEIALTLLKENIVPYEFKPRKSISTLNDELLMEITGIELHLGKLAYKEDTNEEYNWRIAKKRFSQIIEEIVKYQKIQKCGTCLLCIGNDFFNSDNLAGTTTKGTQQNNDLSYKTMYKLGLELYIKSIKTLRKCFNRIDVRLQNGNHDTLSSYHLYMSLSCYFAKCKNVVFDNNYKTVQAYKFGKCAIFFTHGNKNMKRLVGTIPNEFGRIWGDTNIRELHIGHFHSEQLTKEENGLIVRQVSSPSSTDIWHYEERYNSAIHKYQVFVWDKEKGITDIKHISF